MIHPSAIIAPEASIGADVSIGAFTIVHGNAVIGAGTRIDSHCEIGYPTPLAEGAPLILGRDSLIRSHSVFYQGSTFGDRLMTGHRVTVREKTKAGPGMQIGTQTDIQGHCEFGDYVRTHSNVFVSHKTKIGNYVWLFPYVIFTNDPHPPSNVTLGSVVEDYASIAAASTILPGVRIGAHALVAAHSCVARDVEPHTVVGGTPAKFLFKTDEVTLKDGSGRPAYPWPRHFSRGYPDAFREEWQKEQ